MDAGTEACTGTVKYKGGGGRGSGRNFVERSWIRDDQRTRARRNRERQWGSEV